MKWHHVVYACASALSLLVGTARGDSAIIVPFGSCGWTLYGNGMPPPPTVACAPFAAPWAASSGCGSAVGTVLPDASYFITRHILNPTATNLPGRALSYGMGFHRLWWNGVELASGCCVEGCTVLSDVGLVLRPGDNVILVQGQAAYAIGGDPSWHSGGYLDVQIIADSATPTVKRTWGQLKSIYR